MLTWFTLFCKIVDFDAQLLNLYLESENVEMHSNFPKPRHDWIKYTPLETQAIGFPTDLFFCVVMIQGQR